MILHVCTSEEWQRQIDASFYQPKNFEKDGFIHCCADRQLAGVLDRYFKNVAGLLVLEIDVQKLSSEVKYEAGPNGDVFPHVYGTLNKEAIVRIRKLDEG